MKLHLVDIIFCGLAYLVIIFFVIRKYYSKRIRFDDDNDDDDGGIEKNNIPDLDLPPGVCLPKPTHGKTNWEKESINEVNR